MSEEQHILIVTSYSPLRVAISSPINNISLFISQKGGDVTILCRESDVKTVITGRFYKLKVLQKFRGIILDYAYIIWRFLSRRDYEYVISVDRQSLIATYLATLMKPVRHIHLSLELEIEEKKTIRDRVDRFLEKCALKKVDRILIQDEERFRLLAGDTGLDETKACFLPNSRIGYYSGGRQFFFNDKFSIPGDRKIVLCTGSLIKEHLIHEAIKSISSWPDRYVLVLHGWIPHEDYRSYIFDLASEYPGKVYFSTELFAPEELDVLFASVDIGLVLYPAINDNFRYIGHAAGKVFDFMRAGIPIVINKDTNAYKIIDKMNCGVSINSCSEIAAALVNISNDYNTFRDNCLNTFMKYEFTRGFNPFYQSLKNEQ